MRAINSFSNSPRQSFRCLNNAYIILLPKIQSPREAKDYRPITLVHSFAKLLSKLLANRLAPHLPALVGNNQSAFIKRRSILDNYKYVQRAAALLLKKKIPKLLLKLDISKAFDTLSWPFLLEVLQARGLNMKWCEWIATLLSTASSKVLLNGCPGRPIAHLRGVRQGDPLSPLLFIVAMDVLDKIFRRAAEEGILQPCGSPAIKHQCSFYADDVILFASPSRQDGRAVARLLNIFGAASGLKVNLQSLKIYQHSSMSSLVKSSNSQFAIWEFPSRPRNCLKPASDPSLSRLPPS